jgi:hypothetical protein
MTLSSSCSVFKISTFLSSHGGATLPHSCPEACSASEALEGTRPVLLQVAPCLCPSPNSCPPLSTFPWKWTCLYLFQLGSKAVQAEAEGI